MSDPLRFGPQRALDDAPERDRDAKIEHLLLTGLDQYFATQYEQAINIWTRALFIDRNHTRARAYIERARSALAERQRESEELLHKGVAAFERGENQQARRLLHQAIERGAPSEEALAVLERLDRLDSGVVKPLRSGHLERPVWTSQPTTMAAKRRFPRLLLLAGVLALVLAGTAGMASWGRVEWRSLVAREVAAPGPAGVPAPSDALPAVPRRAELALARARALAASGHLRDSLSVLDQIRPTDVQKPDADRLRADLQRQLIGLTKGLAPVPSSSEPPSGRAP